MSDSSEANGISPEAISNPTIPAPPSSETIDDDPVGGKEEAIRFEVTVERQVIIYAPDEEIARQRALNYFGFRPKPGEVLPAKIVEVRQLPKLEDEPQPVRIEGPSGRPSSK